MARIEKKQKHLGFILLVLVIGSVSNKAFCQEHRTWEERFLTQAPEKWREYRAFAGRLQGVRKEIKFNTIAGKRVVWNQFDIEIKQRGGWMLYLTHEFGPHPGNADEFARATVANSRYAFVLSKRTSESDWLVRALDLDPGKNTQFGFPYTREYVLDEASILLRIWNRTIPVMAKEKDFVLKQIRPEKRDGRELVRVDFSHRPNRHVVEQDPFMEGWLVLDPDHYWVVKAAQYTGEFIDGTKDVITLETSYDLNGDGFPVPTQRTTRYKLESGREDEEVGTYDFRKQEEVPEHEFSLSAFGLPEPKGKEIAQPSRWYLWFIGAGVACLALGVYLTHLVRRRRANLIQTTRPGLRESVP